MSKTKILIVEDSAAFLKSVDEILQAENYRTFTAVDADSAWDIVQQHSPDLVLTDINLKPDDNNDRSGLALMEKILQQDSPRKICPILLMSSDASIKDQVNHYLSRDVDFLSKPFDPEILLKKINLFLKSTS